VTHPGAAVSTNRLSYLPTRRRGERSPCCASKHPRGQARVGDAVEGISWPTRPRGISVLFPTTRCGAPVAEEAVAQAGRTFKTKVGQDLEMNRRGRAHPQHNRPQGKLRWTAKPVWECRRRIRQCQAWRVETWLDRGGGSDLSRKTSSPCRHRARSRSHPRWPRRSLPEPASSQAATQAGSIVLARWTAAAWRRKGASIMVPVTQFGITICPHAGGVALESKCSTSHLDTSR